MRVLIAIVSVSLASGCAGGLSGRSAPAWPWVETIPCNSGACKPEDALSAFVLANKFCRDVHNFYESGAFYSSGTQTGIGVVGTLAGAVASPLAGGSAAAAWAGLSGATNALQMNFKDALSTSVMQNRQTAVSNVMEAGLTSYLTKSTVAGTTSQQLVEESIAMASKCSMAPAKSDANALKALASTP